MKTIAKTQSTTAIARNVKVPTVAVIGERMNPPHGWHEQANGELVCPHRDLSVCPSCVAANPEAHDCAGARFWIPISMRAELVNEGSL